MSWLLEGLFCFAIILEFNPAVQHAANTKSNTGDRPDAKALLYDYVRLPEQMRKQMQDRVSEIYRKAGLELEWAACSTGQLQRESYPGCTGFEDATHIIIRIHRKVRSGLKPEAAAETVIPARIINIYFSRVQYEARCLRLPVSNLLAYAVAHEMGHLFLGSDSHTLTGIMAAKWRLPDLIQISQGGPSFTPRECRLIQAEIRKSQQEQALSAIR